MKTTQRTVTLSNTNEMRFYANRVWDLLNIVYGN